jgi:hypothetical protein
MLECPLCGSRNLRYSHRRNRRERLLSLIGIRPLRCRDCRARFVARTWRLSNIRWARCPRCWRTDLATWSPQQHRPSALQRLWLALGAHPWRCEYCRVNFVSFRPAREPYRGRKSHRRMSRAATSRTGEIS